MMPMAFRDLTRLTPEAHAFTRGVQRALGSLGAWEGPAALVATDGKYLVGKLDRMGLRPLRYTVTRSGRLILGSEIGAIAVPFDDVRETGQLDPGEAIAVHLPDRRVLHADEVLDRVVAETSINFAELAEHRLIVLDRAPAAAPTSPPEKVGQRELNLFGWSPERVRTVRHMAETGKEPITSMGYDRPLAPFSAQRPPIAKYFKQIVAVVTNPPIDPLREGSAFDLTVHLGLSPAVNENRAVYEPLLQYRLPSPFLTEDQAARIRAAEEPRALVVDCTFVDPGNGLTSGAKALSRRIAECCRLALTAVKRGEASVVILSDRAAREEEGRLPLPMVLMTSALHNTLVQEGQRRHAGLVVETGDVQEGHDAAVLIANGATAVLPYLYYEVGAPHGSVDRLVAALEETLKRIMSKMGICSVDGYRGSRLFEAVGLHPSVVEHYLPGITSRIGGLELEDIYDDIRARKEAGARAARESDVSIYRKEVWGELQTTARGHDPAAYGRFLALIEETPPVYLRDLLVLRPSEAPLAITEVASDEDIIARVFRGAAMSHGALHRVAHRAIAAAFNHFGAASNCGEGGEDPRRDRGGEWEESRSRIRQVASGRFGVDARYLAHADEISIKIGQGAKPGEGGMLPAGKVTAEVAMIRRTQVGVALISPPPHHDIYSIEDLAELIHDLKNGNRHARVSVKLVAEVGVGTIAAGVAKAHADVVLISGYDGGTGASPQTSLQHAGLPWELGLAETHQTLVLNNLRSRIAVETDGQLKTGRDVAIAALLGAEEFGFATAPLVATGCIMMRVCHLNTCPAGVATQDPQLRAKYSGKPEHVVNFMRFIAEDLREIMAQLGFRTIEEMVGRTDKLEARKAVTHWKAKGLDFSSILYQPDVGPEVGRFCQMKQDHGIDRSLDVTTLLALCEPAIERGEKVIAELPIRNVNRVTGTITSSEITRKHGAKGLPEDTIRLHFKGSAGQSFGAFMTRGMTFSLEGDANDYIGKGLSGGKIIVYPSSAARFQAENNMIVGNVALYGATSGEIYIRGMAGERFAVRNSGVNAVVEAIGDNGCEYMTGGRVVIIGPAGRNFGAGMSGGVAFVLDESGDFARRVNLQMVGIGKVESAKDIAELRGAIEKHHTYTRSEKAGRILREWDAFLPKFVRVMPKDYQRMLACIDRAQAQGLTGDEAIMAAFEENARDTSRVGGN